MNVTFISQYVPERSGLATYCEQLVNELYKADYDVTVVRPEKLSVGNIFTTARTLLLRRPNVVHVQYAIPAFGLTSFLLWPLLYCLRQQGSRVVLTLHEVKRETALLGRMGVWYLRLAARTANHITVHTAEAADILAIRCHVPAECISVVPHPLYGAAANSQNLTELEEKYALGHKRVILFFGFIHVDKGVDHLIEAFAQTRRKHPELRDTILVIAGEVRARQGAFKLFERADRQYEAKLHALVRHHRLGRAVKFTGYVSSQEVAQWFGRASVCVLPYTNLEQSGVINQALTYHTPVIASDLGGLHETLQGTDALVPPADAVALSAKLADYLLHPAKPAALVRKYAAIRRARKLPVVVARLQEIYAGEAHA